MPYVSKEQLTAAREVDLLTYLRCFEPQELVHISGSTYVTRTHDSLKISNGKWFWWSRGIGGRNALDYLTAVEGLWLFGCRSAHPRRIAPCADQIRANRTAPEN